MELFLLPPSGCLLGEGCLALPFQSACPQVPLCSSDLRVWKPVLPSVLSILHILPVLSEWRKSSLQRGGLGRLAEGVPPAGLCFAFLDFSNAALKGLSVKPIKAFSNSAGAAAAALLCFLWGFIPDSI